MKSVDIFSSDFVTAVTTKLDEVCVDGARITRGNLLRSLDVEVDDKHRPAVEAVLGTAVSLGVFPGYDNAPGLDGGVGKVGVKAPKAAKQGPKPVTFQDGFIDNLVSTLNKVLVGSTAMPRRDIAAAMGSPGSDTEQLISAALRQGMLPDFESIPGAKGGVRRKQVLTPVADPTPAKEETAQAAEEVAAESPESVNDETANTSADSSENVES